MKHFAWLLLALSFTSLAQVSGVTAGNPIQAQKMNEVIQELNSLRAEVTALKVKTNFTDRTYSPSLSAYSGAPTSYTSSFKYSRLGKYLLVKGTITFNAASAAFTCLQIPLPENLLMDEAGQSTLSSAYLFDVSSSSTIEMNIIQVTSSKLQVAYPVTNPGANPQRTNMGCTQNVDPIILAAGDYYNVSFMVPIAGWEN